MNGEDDNRDEILQQLKALNNAESDCKNCFDIQNIIEELEKFTQRK